MSLQHRQRYQLRLVKAGMRRADGQKYVKWTLSRGKRSRGRDEAEQDTVTVMATGTGPRASTPRWARVTVSCPAAAVPIAATRRTANLPTHSRSASRTGTGVR